MNNFICKLKRDYKDCLVNNKLFLVFFISFFILGIIIAIICYIQFRDIITIKNLTDKFLIDFLKGQKSIFGYCFLKFLKFILIYFLVILLCYNNFSCYLICLYVLYFSYSLVFNLCLISLCFGFFGFIFGLLFILLFGLMYLMLICSLSLFCKSYCKNCRRYFDIFYDNCQGFLIILGITLILLILELIFIPMLTKTFIIVL